MRLTRSEACSIHSPVTRPPTVDIHAHFFPEGYLKLTAEEGERCGVRLSRSDPKGPVIEAGQVRTGPLRAAFSDLDLRLKEMNRQGVRIHALSLTLPMVYWADGELGLRLARIVNDALAQAHTAFPDRFVGLLTLPMQEPKLALEELDRAARLPGIRGVYLGTNVRGRELSDPDFFPVYERMETVKLPLLLHPLNVIGAQRLATLPRGG